jgi:hypothetical protein
VQQRRAAIPLSLVWLASVAGMWALTTTALAVLISTQTGHAAASGLLSQSALSAALACVVVGGPATAAALHVRRRRRLGPAALTGVAVAVLVLLFIWSYMAASGTALHDTWSAVTPALVVTVVQLAVAFVVRGRRAEEPAPAPAPAPEPVAAEPAEPPDGAGLPAGGPGRPPGVDHGLEVGSGPELRHRGLRNLDGRSGSRVARGPGRPDLLLEHAEAGDRHLVSARDRLLDGHEHGVDSVGSRPLVVAHPVGHGVD